MLDTKKKCNIFDKMGWNGTDGLYRAEVAKTGTVLPGITTDGVYVTVPVSVGWFSTRNVRFKGRKVAEYYRFSEGGYGPSHHAMALFEVPGGYRVWDNNIGSVGLHEASDVLTFEEMVKQRYSRMWPEFFPEYIEDIDINVKNPQMCKTKNVIASPLDSCSDCNGC